MAPVFPTARELAGRLGTTALVAQVLANRGLGEPAAAKAFLQPKLTDLHDPALLAGAQQAALLIVDAVRRGRKIVIYGDYDVDGMTAVAILHACLKMLGAKADFYVPHRLDEGYGVNAEAIAKIVADGAELIVTVDCGISAAGPMASAVAAGVDVIVTDHHSPPEQLPPAGGRSCIRGFPRGRLSQPGPAGAGVAFKLAWQVAGHACAAPAINEAMRTSCWTPRAWPPGHHRRRGASDWREPLAGRVRPQGLAVTEAPRPAGPAGVGRPDRREAGRLPRRAFCWPRG